MKKSAEVVIIGGGVIGCAIACNLANIAKYEDIVGD
jgi:glycine/D-amino acid oxidase-like deaminating enzyme